MHNAFMQYKVQSDPYRPTNELLSTSTIFVAVYNAIIAIYVCLIFK